MRDTRQRLIQTDFPPIRRGRLEILQVNLGYRCNLSCTHCHVNAGPKRTEAMDKETVDTVLAFIDRHAVGTLDVTGGAPEMNRWFRYLVAEARARGAHVIDRCNLTVLLEPGFEGMAAFLAGHGVEVVASLPCYTAENVDGQRGKGTFNASIEALRRLNALGYGREGALALNLVYNPTGAYLPPPQADLEHDYKRRLADDFGIAFNHLYTITNMPISRFGAVLLAQGQFEDYMALLKRSYADANLPGVMCRNTLSVDWQGRVYDCDFNQMLGLPMLSDGGASRWHLADLLDRDLTDRPIAIGDHCYGCTAGQGSSCGGALL